MIFSNEKEAYHLHWRILHRMTLELDDADDDDDDDDSAFFDLCVCVLLSVSLLLRTYQLSLFDQGIGLGGLAVFFFKAQERKKSIDTINPLSK